ncbi:MAG: hypothetical protein HYX75_01560 [Acidobacteria bacterium]|nr:hypothetical protein [Acidobacteriota bacterium]
MVTVRKPARGHWSIGVAAASALLFQAYALHAQFVTGTADWSLGRSTYSNDGDATRNNSFAQSYALTYNSVLWDPRFLQYTAGLSFQKTSLTIVDDKSGAANTGFNVTANLFPARPFPLTIYARRTTGNETGNFPSSGPIRGGVVIPPGGSLPEVKNLLSSLGVNWHLDREDLPRVELAYKTDRTTQEAGSQKAAQKNTNLNVSATRETKKTRSTLRYLRQAFDNRTIEAFSTRNSELSYDMNANVSAKTRADFRTGYIDSYSLFDLPREVTGIGGGGSYQPPSRGSFKLFYGTASLSHQPTDRLTTSATTSYERGSSDAASTSAVFLSSRNTFRLLRGLSLTGRVSIGQRGQVSDGDDVSVHTRNLGGGAVYTVPWRVAQIGVGYDYDSGWSRSQEGLPGRSTAWRAEASAATGAFKVVNLSASYERSRSNDELLTFGNYEAERLRGSAQSQPIGRIRLLTTFEKSRIARGTAESLATNRAVVVSAEAQFDLGRSRRLSVTAGSFVNDTGDTRDRNRYIGLDFEASLTRSLHVTFTARRELYKLQGFLDQSGIRTQGKLDYRLRQFTFGLEYRYTTLRQAVAAAGSDFNFEGNQLVLRVTRKFGFML